MYRKIVFGPEELQRRVIFLLFLLDFADSQHFIWSFQIYLHHLYFSSMSRDLEVDFFVQFLILNLEVELRYVSRVDLRFSHLILCDHLLQRIINSAQTTGVLIMLVLGSAFLFVYIRRIYYCTAFRYYTLHAQSVAELRNRLFATSIFESADAEVHAQNVCLVFAG